MRSAPGFRIAEVVIATVLWSVLCVGSAVLALTVPAYTSAVTRAIDVPRTAGLSPAEVVQLSGAVRALVADPTYEPLPQTWRGALAFDEAAVSHLLDVRAVISGARLATWVSALLLALYVSVLIARHRLDRMSGSLRAAAWALLGAVVLAVAVAFTDFEWFFTRFHGLFFQSGTWTFPFDSLLIRLFPEQFWIVSGACWAALTLVLAAVLGWAARSLGSASRRQGASRTAENV